jgi:hypothetical protein
MENLPNISMGGVAVGSGRPMNNITTKIQRGQIKKAMFCF